MYIAARAKHYDYIPAISWINLDYWVDENADGEITCSWSPVTDLDGDSVQYFAEISDWYNPSYTYGSGWINQTSYTIPLYFSTFICKVKTRDNFTNIISSGVPSNYISPVYSLNSNYVELKVNDQVNDVNDVTSPTTTLTLSGVLGNNSWYISDVQVNLSATDNQGGSGVNKTEYSFDRTNWSTYITPFNISTEGIRTLYYNSTDRLGNIETTQNKSIKIDIMPPNITFNGPETVNLNASASVIVSVNDDISDIIFQSSPDGSNLLDTSAVGLNTFVVTARDTAGNENTSTYTYRVTYDFYGTGSYLPPVMNPPYTNLANAGSTIPMKWQLPDGNGEFISNLNAVTNTSYQEASCSDFSTTLTNEIPANATGNSGLHYDTTTGQYIFNWKTDHSMSGKCYLFILELNDGNKYNANFDIR